MKKLFLLFIIIFCQINIYCSGDDDLALSAQKLALEKPVLNFFRDKYQQYASSMRKSNSLKKLDKLVQNNSQIKVQSDKTDKCYSFTNPNPLLKFLENLSQYDLEPPKKSRIQVEQYFPAEIICEIIKNFILYEIFQEEDYKDIQNRLEKEKEKEKGLFNLKNFLPNDILTIIRNSKGIFTLFRTNRYLSNLTFFVLVDIFKNTKISKQCLAIILSTLDIYSLKETYDFGNSILKSILTEEEISKDNNIFKRSDLALAASLNCVEAVKQLIKHKADVNFKDAQDNSTPLMSAAINNHLTCATILLKAGADIYAINDNKESALSLACSQNDQYCELVKLLIEYLNEKKVESNNAMKHQLIINLINKDGVTPLINAIIRKYKNIISLLIESGADVNITCASNFSPLFYAVQTKNLEAASILIENNANVNYQGKYNLTPLIKATQQMDEEMVRLLKKTGANVYLKDDQNRTAIDYAQNNQAAFRLRQGFDGQVAKASAPGQILSLLSTVAKDNNYFLPNP